MRYGSVCSGIEAATVAWHPLGWKPAFFSEIEKFPRHVLAHHYQDVPLHGDFLTIKGDEYGAIDLLVGGTPCQSFSVAGLRKGMDDPRGNLALGFLGLLARTRPRWVVWENVPGVLSSNKGRDFGAFLGGLGQLGYGWAYRVLDAQFFGVPQRRRRVFVVGHLGDWRPAAAVLFERQSLSGNPAPCRKAGPGVAALTANGVGTCGADDNQAQAGHLNQVPGQGSHWEGTDVHPCLNQSSAKSGGVGSSNQEIFSQKGAYLVPGNIISMATGQAGADSIHGDFGPSLTCNHEAPIICEETAATLKGGSGQRGWSCDDGAPIVAHALRAEGHDASEDGTGRQNLVISVHGTQDPDVQIENAHTLGRNSGQENAICYPINTQIAMRHEALGKGTGLGIGAPNDPSFTLQENHHHAVSVSLRGREGGGTAELTEGAMPARRASQGGGDKPHVLTSAVRRLLPEECEKLQGFPVGYTKISAKTADGPRYKALGNSMAVPCMRWIGERIEMVEALL